MRVTSSKDVAPGEWSEVASGRIRVTSYFGGRSGPQVVQEGPQGFLVEHASPHAVVRPHFHPVRQFQVILRGERLGKKPVAPFSFQYADANTPYGPIIGGEDGLAFFTLRPEQSTAIYYMPESRDKLPGKAGRNVAAHFAPADTVAQSASGGPVVTETLLEPAADGMQAARLTLRPNAEGRGIDPTRGGGQYYLVVSGSLVHEGKELPELSMLWVDPDEPAPSLTAGPSGADLLVMQFPVNEAQSPSPERSAAPARS